MITLLLAAFIFCTVLVPSVHAESADYEEQVRRY